MPPFKPTSRDYSELRSAMREKHEEKRFRESELPKHHEAAELAADIIESNGKPTAITTDFGRTRATINATPWYKNPDFAQNETTVAYRLAHGLRGDYLDDTALSLWMRLQQPDPDDPEHPFECNIYLATITKVEFQPGPIVKFEDIGVSVEVPTDPQTAPLSAVSTYNPDFIAVIDTLEFIKQAAGKASR